MDAPSPSPGQPAARSTRLFLTAAACGLLIGSLLWFKPSHVADFLHADRHPAARPPAAKVGGEPGHPLDAAQTARVQDIIAHWNERKTRLRQLLTVDYPAALARRNTKYPDLDAVVKFGQEYGPNYERTHVELARYAEEQFRLHEAKYRELQAQRRDIGDELLFYGRTLTASQPAAGSVTVGDLARQFTVDDPNGLIYLRRMVANTERRTFQDEETAKKIEDMQSPEEMLTYIKGALPRWEARQAQVYAEAGIDERTAGYAADFTYTNLLGTVSRAYGDHGNAELVAIDKEGGQILQAMDEPLLAAASRDDPESRRLLTDLQELILLRQQQKKP